MKRSGQFLAVLLALILLFTCAPFAFAKTGNSANSYRVGDTIKFGTYPQTNYTETKELKKAASAATWKSYGYYSGTDKGYYHTITESWSAPNGEMAPSDFMQFADFFCGGNKYRAVKFTQYRPEDTNYKSGDLNSNQDDNFYYTNTVYYFKYEPLTWRVLDPSTGYIMCESVIDSQPYQNLVWYYEINDEENDYYFGEYYQGIHSTTLANDYVTSSIRAWLNYDFYETAFTQEQKANIKTTVLDNSAYDVYGLGEFPGGAGNYNSAATEDKIYLLSYADATNSAYGFSPSNEMFDTSRAAKSTNYAKCQGLSASDSLELTNGSLYDGTCWRLRTPNSYTGSSSCGVVLGNIKSFDVGDTEVGVRPACCLLKLDTDTALSKTLFSGGNGSSGDGGSIVVIGHDHNDEDNDGYCDDCSEMMTGGNHCKLCGKVHDGTFGWFVRLLHRIFALFKR
ncbi:MAG: hypothetical protein IJL52_06565 [Clostridia bacterium]|nr:hypothetical protein [Clostridia bacterium]